MDSPCVQICAFDPESGLCTGCGRTLAEIGEWAAASSDRRRAIAALLPERMARLERQEPR